MFLKYNDIHTVIPQSTDDIVVSITIPGNCAHMFGKGTRKTNGTELLAVVCLTDDMSSPYQQSEQETVHMILDQEDSDCVVKLFDLYLEAKKVLSVCKKYDLQVPYLLYEKLESQYKVARAELIDRYNILPTGLTKYGTFNEFSNEEKEDAS